MKHQKCLLLDLSAQQMSQFMLLLMPIYEHQKGRDRDVHLSKISVNGATTVVPATVKILDAMNPSPSMVFPLQKSYKKCSMVGSLENNRV